jgi:hypothetical protein
MLDADKFLWMIDKDGTLYRADQNGASTVLGEKGSYGQTNNSEDLEWKALDGRGRQFYKTS